MISLTRFVAAAAVATALTGTAWAGSTLDRIHETKVLKVATSANWPPQSFLGPDNKLQGFDIDVASEIGKRLGSKVDFVTPEYGIITAGRWSNRWDLSVGSMTPTTERTRVLDFPAIYYYTPYVFAVHKDAAGTKLADLNGKIIGVEAGTTSEDYINRRLKIDAADVPPLPMTSHPARFAPTATAWAHWMTCAWVTGFAWTLPCPRFQPSSRPSRMAIPSSKWKASRPTTNPWPSPWTRVMRRSTAP